MGEPSNDFGFLYVAWLYYHAITAPLSILGKVHAVFTGNRRVWAWAALMHAPKIKMYPE